MSEVLQAITFVAAVSGFTSLLKSLVKKVK